MLKKVMYFVISCSLIVISINVSAELKNCVGMNKKVTIEECKAFHEKRKIEREERNKRDEERKAKKLLEKEERKQKDVERAKRDEEREVQRNKERDERKQRNKERGEHKQSDPALEDHNKQDKPANFEDRKKIREQERLAKEEARKKRDEEREAKRLLEKEERNAKRAKKLEERKQRDAEIAAKNEQERLEKLENNKQPAEEVKPKIEPVNPAGGTQTRNNIPPNTMPKPVVISSVAYGGYIGEYRGVVAYSNGDCAGISRGLCDHEDHWKKIAYHQCVDYAKRFYWKHFSKVSEANESWGSAYDFWKKPNYTNLVRHRVGQTSLLPKQGDMLFFKAGEYGHVAIVTEVSNDMIELIQQNIKPDTAKAWVRYKNQNGIIVFEQGMLFPDGTTSQKTMELLGWLSPS